jgi:Ca2+-binding EF-hand superfamily protein
VSDPRRQIIEKVTELVKSAYGGNWRKAFAIYDVDADGRISNLELTLLLVDAGVGNWWTRSEWARRIVEVMDANADGKISFEEFLAEVEAK